MKKSYLVRLSGMAAVFGLVMAIGGSASAADRPPVEECMRCHDVKQYQHELKNSAHAFDKDKKEISCEQCHVFHFSPLTSYYARDKYFDKKIFEPGTFDRRQMQKNARQTDLTAKCQECHKDLTKNVKGEPVSLIGSLAHEAFLGKNGTTRKTCAGCHINMAHLPDFDKDLMINAEFAKKLAENPAPAAEKGGE
ncbi:MAG: NapC/NirT family cytochrome c [Thermodesulfobacteriota bacterium]|nr:NapC/NirT family cytochrome c [Thermodesulfobacteriota bacterium]